MKLKILNHLKNNRLYYLTLLTGIIVISIIYFFQQITPFGNNSLLKIDFYQQYASLLMELYNRIKVGSNIVYSFTMGLGLPFIKNFMNYLSSPFNILMLFFQQEKIITSFSIIIGLKISLIALTTTYYLSKKFMTQTLFLIPLSLLYAFSAWVTAYYWNIMWLDGLIMLPLIIYGIENLINNNKSLFYIISLSLAIFSNYYIGYMLCYFACIYFVCYLILKSHNLQLKIIGKKILVFTLSSLLSGGLIAFAIVPLYLGLDTISATSDAWPVSQQYTFTIWEFIGNHFSGVGSTVISTLASMTSITNAPNISCGVLSVVLLILFIINKSIKLKVKIIYLLMLFFLAFSFFFAPLDYIWNAFHNVNDLPYRYSFIYSFVLIIICTYSFINLGAIAPKKVAAVYLSAIILIGFLKFFQYQNIDNKIILLNQLALTIYFILYCLYQYKPSLKKYIPYLFIFMIIVELSITINNNWQTKYTLDNIYSDFSAMQNALKYIRENNNDNMFRIEKTDKATSNDSSWYNYYGHSTFTSMAYEKLAILNKKLGIQGNNINNYTYLQNTPIYDLMFNIKYIIGNSQDEKRYKLFYNEDNISVYENQYTSGLLYAVNKDIIDWRINDNNPFEIQNNYIEKATGVKDIFIEEQLIKKEIIYKENEITLIKYTFNKPQDNLYFYVGDNNVDHFILNNTLYYGINPFTMFKSEIEPKVEKKVSYNSMFEKFIITTNIVSDTYDVYICYHNYKYDSFYSYTINYDKFKEAVLILQNNKVNINIFKENYIKANYITEKDQIIYTSIPYDRGWNVYINNKKVNTFKIGDALLGFDINSGENEIILQYELEGNTAGIIISIISLTIIIIGFRKKFLH